MRNALQSQISDVGILIQQGNITKALATSELLTKNFPEFEDSWMNLFQLSRHIGEWGKAERAINNLIKLSPKNESFKIQKVFFLEESYQLPRAIKEAVELSKFLGDTGKLSTLLSQFLCKHQQYQEALFLYGNQLKLAPSDPELLINCATMNQYLGNMREAERLSNLALESNPYYSEAYFFRSHLTKVTDKNNNIKEIEKLLMEKNLSQIERAKLFYSLAKEAEDCVDFEKSFEARKQGAKIYRGLFNYDINSDLAFIDELLINYEEGFLNKKSNGFSTSEPIFIVGLPRSGTTLLERIISNHKDVQTEGELNNFHNEILRSFRAVEKNQQIVSENMVAISKSFDFNALGKNYVESTRYSTGHKKHFVDKFPQNSLHVGLINKALPNAKIVILERHPIDVCYAVFKQIFTNIYQFSYDLEELANYYVHHHKLMKHWQKCLPNSVYTIRYENIIEDLEGETQKLLKFLNLEWDENCLNFHKNKQASSTASSSQVRNGLYSSSVGLWKNYEQQLSPLIDILQSNNCLTDWQ